MSTAGLQRASERHPRATFIVMRDERLDMPDAAVDLVLSVEVLEHVADVRLAVHEIARVLRPGGSPSSRRPAPTGVAGVGAQPAVAGRPADQPGRVRAVRVPEPGHLRRLQSRDLDILLRDAGLVVGHFAFRAHLFTTLAALPLAALRRRMKLAMLDWRWWRHRANAATMIAVGRKPA